MFSAAVIITAGSSAFHHVTIGGSEYHNQQQVDRTLQIVWNPIAIVSLFVVLKNEDMDH